MIGLDYICLLVKSLEVILQFVGVNHQLVGLVHVDVHHLEPHHRQLPHPQSLTAHEVLAGPVVVLRGVDEDGHVAGVVGLEPEPGEAGGVRGVDHDVHQVEGVEGEGGEDHALADPPHVPDHLAQRNHQLLGGP